MKSVYRQQPTCRQKSYRNIPQHQKIIYITDCHRTTTLVVRPDRTEVFATPEFTFEPAAPVRCAESRFDQIWSSYVDCESNRQRAEWRCKCRQALDDQPQTQLRLFLWF